MVGLKTGSLFLFSPTIYGRVFFGSGTKTDAPNPTLILNSSVFTPVGWMFIGG